MKDFLIRRRGQLCRGTVLDFGPYPTRLVVRVKDPGGEFPSDSAISRACGEEVQHWVSGELAGEEIFLRVGDDVAAATNAAIMFG